MPYDNVSEVINELFESLLSRYQVGLKTSMRGSDLIFHSVQLLYYKCHKIKSPDWIKKKKATITPKNTDDKCFQYVEIVALNHEEIKRDPQRISKFKLFINKCNWTGIKYPSKIDDWKTFDKNNPTIAHSILYIKEKEICPAYISKHNSTREKQIILLMIPNEEEEGWHYLTVKKLLALLHRITSKNKGDFFCSNCLHSFRTKNKLKSDIKSLIIITIIIIKKPRQMGV